MAWIGALGRSGGGAEGIKIRYIEEDDVVQLYYDGQWRDWKSGGMAYPVGTEINFGYTGAVQSFEIPATGIWKLECWGAQGDGWNHAKNGGRGGYCYGNVSLEVNQILKIVVGGQLDGYNGGGVGPYQAYGGGCTHIAKDMGDSAHNTLRSYSNEATAINYVFLVAAGGGATWVASTSYGGAGGGLTGGNGAAESGAYVATGGSQSSAGSSSGGGAGGFGYGGRGTRTGGGAGWYGGGASVGGSGDGCAGGGGGSSWYGGCIIGSVGTTSGQNTGNGKAKLTYLGRGA